MLTPLSALLTLLLPYILAILPTLKWQQDIEKDIAKLQAGSSYFISDNSTFSPSLQTIIYDLQLFQLTASLDLQQAAHSSSRHGNHQVDVWRLKDGEVKALYQIESNLHIDTVVTQHYLDNRPPTQQRITNRFTFRTYIASTASEPAKLFYLTEAEQGLLSYRLGKKQVEINYAASKEGLADIIEGYKKEVNNLVEEMDVLK